MKYAFLVLVTGYVSILIFPRVEGVIIPLSALLLFSLIAYLFWKRIDTLPSIGRKFLALVILMVISALLFGLISLSIINDWMSIYYYPPVFAAIILFRKVLKKIINLTIKEPQSFGVQSETLKGETVRSKSEAKVANWLFNHDYEYEYEREINLGGGKTILSDFYLPEHDIYIEYWGLSSADNEAGEKYRERKAEKIELYENNDLKLLSIYPHHLYELDSYVPNQIAELNNKKQGFWAWLIGLFSNNEDVEMKNQDKIYCTNCGSSLVSEGDFCTNCGKQSQQIQS